MSKFPVKFVDLNSSRNLFILGFSLFFGLMMPIWVKGNSKINGVETPNSASLALGYPVFDQV